MTELRVQVFKIIQDRGRSNPVRGCDIIRILNLKEDKNKFGAKLRKIVNGLRMEGQPVCASGKGYYYPQNCGELKEYMDSFKNRIKAQMGAYNGMLKLYEQMKHSEWILCQQEKILQDMKIRQTQPAMV